MYNQEHKISQYADDTTLITRANESSIRTSMSVLKEFENISGLQINKEKTKVINIGGWRGSRIKFCEELSLDWTNKFISLGIEYNIDDFNNITDININNKIREIQKLVYIWSSRNLTPYGKITIIKSLLISKITHILLSLPSPNQKTFEELENIFKRFVWNYKNPKFRKEITENLKDLGGLKMSNLETFDAALKISWLKRIISQTLGWAEFPNQLNIHKIILYGNLYPKVILKTIENQFWKDMVRSVIRLTSNFKIRNTTQLHLMPLWYSGELDLGFRQSWKNKGYMVVGDILNQNGELLTKEELKEKDLTINFLDYFRIKQKINGYIENFEKVAPIHGPQIPRVLFEIGMTQTGCGRVYNKLMDFDTGILTEVKNKWENTLNEEIPYKTIENAFKEISKIKTGSYQKYFQFKLLHSRIITNEKLFIMNLSDSKMCKTCLNKVDTLRQAFIDCHATVMLWENVEDWAKTVISNSFKITDTEKIFGISKRQKD